MRIVYSCPEIELNIPGLERLSPESDVSDSEAIVSILPYGLEDLAKLRQRAPRALQVAFIIEPRAIAPQSYINLEGYDHILTFDKALLESLPRSSFFAAGGLWVGDSSPEKTRSTSCVISAKKRTVGHKLRHDLIPLMREFDVHLLGDGVGDRVSKEEGLGPYRFSVVIENSKQPHYYTEKIVDAFHTLTVPIYWGCPSINQFYNHRGILQWNTAEELRGYLSSIQRDPKALYEQILPYLVVNKEHQEQQLWGEYAKRLKKALLPLVAKAQEV